MDIPLLSFSVFFYLLSVTAASTTSYYINCGATSSTTEQGQVFTGDSSPPSGVKLLFQGSTTSSSNSNNSISSTARAFTSNSSYQFDTSPGAGTYLLRLHLFAFSNTLASAHFIVSSNGHTLLPNFTGSEALNSPVLKEFLVPVEPGEDTLRLYFIPIGPSGSAFVNAIELIFAPLNLTDLDSPILVTPSSGYNGSFGHLGSRVLSPLYRLNVGGSNVTASVDTLRRNWWQDDSYLVAGKDFATRIGPSSMVNWQNGNSSLTDAPEQVYNTARGWNASSDSTANVTRNATWSFSASNNTSYFVRLHFCDIVSIALGEISFNLYLFNKFAWEVSPFNITGGDSNSAPFRLDFVVKSDSLGFINLTVGSLEGVGGAFLNGLEIMGFVDGSTTEPSIRSGGGGGSKVVLIVCAAAAGVVILLVAAGLLLWWVKRKGKGVAAEASVEDFDWPLAVLNASSESKSTTTASDNTTSLSSLPSLHLRIPIGVIKQVTRNFDEELVIGQGGFGKVYKGVLKNGLQVAVKRSDSKHGQGLPEFQTEITVLSRIRHRHLVSLIGYCDENDEMILVYEYMEKGTLREHLYVNSADHPSFEPMPWKQRLEICIGAAKGLHYLHTGSTGGIIHRDVKSTNILLDHNLVAKVADFGLSRSGALEQDTHVSTVVKGTFGYLDPEYYQLMQLTDKSDVYSFGVLLLEVLCARLVLDTSLPRDEVNLADWAISCHRNGELERIIDPFLVGQINPNSLAKFVETAGKCLKESGTDRPPMSDVLWDLEYTLQLHKFGVGGFGDSTINSTTQASFNLPMLDVTGFSSTAFSTKLDEEDDGNVEDSGLVTSTMSIPDDSVSPPY